MAGSTDHSRRAAGYGDSSASRGDRIRRFELSHDAEYVSRQGRALGPQHPVLSVTVIRRVTGQALALMASAAIAGAQAHPSVFLTARDAAAVRAGASKYPLLGESLRGAKRQLADAMSRPT